MTGHENFTDFPFIPDRREAKLNENARIIYGKKESILPPHNDMVIWEMDMVCV